MREASSRRRPLLLPPLVMVSLIWLSGCAVSPVTVLPSSCTTQSAGRELEMPRSICEADSVRYHGARVMMLIMPTTDDDNDGDNDDEESTTKMHEDSIHACVFAWNCLGADRHHLCRACHDQPRVTVPLVAVGPATQAEAASSQAVAVHRCSPGGLMSILLAPALTRGPQAAKCCHRGFQNIEWGKSVWVEPSGLAPDSNTS